MTTTASNANDLPQFLAGIVHPTANARVVEAVGYGPLSQKVITKLNLLSIDEHSDNHFALSDRLRRNSDGSPAVTCERWIRLQFTQPYTAVQNVRFWVPNLTSTDWTVQFGTSNIYQPPLLDQSPFAVFPVPTADPGTFNIDARINGHEPPYSKWLILQATWNGGHVGTIQTTPLNFTFAWTEC